MVVVTPERPAEESHRIGAEFLITDLDVALTFMDIADTSTNQETVRRNRENARLAYETVSRLLSKLKVNDPARQIITERMGKLKARLEAAGYHL